MGLGALLRLGAALAVIAVCLHYYARYRENDRLLEQARHEIVAAVNARLDRHTYQPLQTVELPGPPLFQPLPDELPFSQNIFPARWGLRNTPSARVRGTFDRQARIARGEISLPNGETVRFESRVGAPAAPCEPPQQAPRGAATRSPPPPPPP